MSSPSPSAEHPGVEMEPVKNEGVLDENETSQNVDSAQEVESVEKGAHGDLDATNYILGWRLHTISAALSLCLLLVNLEIPIVSTSLVGITNDLGGFSKSSWIITSFMLTYVGFLIIWAKLSDIYGRKPTLVVGELVFIIFSGGCGAAQTVTQLSILRAFQGIGAACVNGVGINMFFELVPLEKWPTYTSLVALVFSLSLFFGPILGGVINRTGNWRWVFLLNVPAGLIGLVIVLLVVPKHFPHQGKPSHQARKTRDLFVASSLKRIDWLGAFMLLAASVLIVSAFEEAGTRFPWRSAYFIVLIIIACLLWISFPAWERYVTRAEGVREPVLPWRFATSRVWIGMLLTGFFTGPAMTVPIFEIPQRFQVVNGSSSLRAGLQLVPFSVFSPVGSIAGAVISKKIPPIYTVVAGSLLQVLGFALLSTASTSTHILARQYGYQIIAGFGTGINIAVLTLMVPHSGEKRDQAVAVGAFNQFRLMGGAIGLAVTSSVLNSFVRSHLASFTSPSLSSAQITSLLQSSNTLRDFSPDLQEKIKVVFARGYNLQLKIVIAFSAAQLVGTAIMWRKRNIRV